MYWGKSNGVCCLTSVKAHSTLQTTGQSSVERQARLNNGLLDKSLTDIRNPISDITHAFEWETNTDSLST